MGGLSNEVSSLIGGGPNNQNFQAQGVPLATPVSGGQVNQAYGYTQTGIGQQQSLVDALIAQGGLNNQSAAYTGQAGLAGQLGGLNGVANQGAVFGQQQDLANALLSQSQGTGPNPAQTQLNQTTGQNIASEGALIGSARGAASNPGLIAREAAQQGGAIQQQAVGQAATLRAQQQIAAQQQLQQQQAALQQAAQGQTAQEQAALQAQAATATQQANQYQTGVGGYNQIVQGAQSNLLGGINAQNNAAVGIQGNINSTNQAQAGINANNSAKFVSSGINSIGGALGLGGSGGGLGGGAAGSPGATTPAGLGTSTDLGPGLSSSDLSFAQSAGPAAAAFAHGGEVEMPDHLKHMATVYHGDAMKMTKGGKVPALLSPGERYLPPGDVKKVAQGKESPSQAGKKVPGKAAISGDSKKNDTVPAKLEEGGMVIPRSVMQSDNPEEAAKKFVAQHLAKHGSGDHKADFKEALKKAIAGRKTK